MAKGSATVKALVRYEKFSFVVCEFLKFMTSSKTFSGLVCNILYHFGHTKGSQMTVFAVKMRYIPLVCLWPLTASSFKNPKIFKKWCRNGVLEIASKIAEIFVARFFAAKRRKSPIFAKNPLTPSSFRSESWLSLDLRLSHDSERKLLGVSGFFYNCVRDRIFNANFTPGHSKA